MTAELVWNWPYWFFAGVIYLSFIIVGGSLIFFLYTIYQELRAGTAW